MLDMYKFLSLVKAKLKGVFSYQKRIIMPNWGKAEAYWSCLSHIKGYNFNMSLKCSFCIASYFYKKFNSQNLIQCWHDRVATLAFDVYVITSV